MPATSFSLTTTALLALAGAALASPCVTHDHAQACDAGQSERSPASTAVQPAGVGEQGLEFIRTKAGFIDDVRRGYELAFPLFAACFDPDNPPRDEVILALEETLYSLNQRYQLASRWTGSQGTHITLTWSLVPDGLFIPAALSGEASGNSELFSRMDSLFAGQGGRPTWIAAMESVYARWTELSGITFQRITVGGNDWDDGASWNSSGSTTRGNMRVAMKTIDGSGGVLAYNFFPGSGNGGNMVMDRAESWQSPTNSNRYMRNIVSHEVGHGIGFNHVCPANSSKLMEPFATTSFDGPRHDDLRAVQRHYGDFYTPNTSTALAHPLGVIMDGQSLFPCTVPPPTVSFGSICSMDRTADNDYFSIELAAPGTLSVTMNPVGFSYLSGPQNANGSCSAGTTINTLAISDVNIQLLDSGSNVVTTAASNPAGQSESFSEMLPAGLYYIRVYQTGTISQSQLYNLVISYEEEEISQPCPGDLNGDGEIDFDDLGMVLSGFGTIYDFDDLGAVLGAFGTSCP